MDKFLVSPLRVVLDPFIEDEKTAGGIILTGAVENYPKKAKVMAVSDEYREVKFFKEGDIVLYNQSNVIDVMINGTKYLLTTERDIYGKITK
jgi:chaperonin GroES